MTTKDEKPHPKPPKQSFLTGGKFDNEQSIGAWLMRAFAQYNPRHDRRGIGLSSIHDRGSGKYEQN